MTGPQPHVPKNRQFSCGEGGNCDLLENLKSTFMSAFSALSVSNSNAVIAAHSHFGILSGFNSTEMTSQLEGTAYSA